MPLERLPQQVRRNVDGNDARSGRGEHRGEHAGAASELQSGASCLQPRCRGDQIRPPARA
jgi:hypothetical protein